MQPTQGFNFASDTTWQFEGSSGWPRVVDDCKCGRRSLPRDEDNQQRGNCRVWEDASSSEAASAREAQLVVKTPAGPLSAQTVATIILEFKRLSDLVHARTITDKQAHCRLSCLICALMGPLNAAAAGILKEAFDEVFPGGSGWSQEDIVADVEGLKCCGSMGWTAYALALIWGDAGAARSHCEECCR